MSGGAFDGSGSSSGDAVGDLVRALASVTSYSAADRKAATRYLEKCQPLPGFLTAIVGIVGNRNGLPVVSVEVRMQAAILFKNSLDKFWRKSAGPSAIDAQNKQLIRSRLLALVDEPDRAIANTVAFCVGKIARLDYDEQWPDLFTNLQATIERAVSSMAEHPEARLVLVRALRFYQQAVKKLSENRVAKGKNLMGRLANESTPALAHLYRHFLTSATSSLASFPGFATQGDEQASDSALCNLTLKILIRLTVYGWGGPAGTLEEKDSFTAAQSEFVKSTLPDFTALVNLRKDKVLAGLDAARDGAGIKSVNKLVKTQGKFFSALLRQNHVIFHELGVTHHLMQTCWQYIEEASQNVTSYISDDDTALWPEKFLVQQMLLIKMCFTQSPYNSANIQAPDFAKACVSTIVTKLLPLRSQDLEKWHADPEEWMREEEDDRRWQFDLRPCSEAYFQELVRDYEADVTPLLRDLLHQASAGSSFEAILAKEAVYSAYSRATTALNKQIPFGPWLNDTLIPESQSTDEARLPLRRRIASLVGSWASEENDVATTVKVYQVLIHLLQKNASTDLATRLTAANGLKLCDAWSFDVQSFLPFLDPALRSLAELLSETELPETHSRIADILGLLIDRAGKEIAGHLSLLMEILPRLWLSAQEQGDSNFKMSVIGTLRKLVEALQEQSQVLHAPICQFIRYSCDPTSPGNAIMQEDGMDLWKSTVKYASGPSPELMDLAPLAVASLAGGSDGIKDVLHLVEAYTLLDPHNFVPQQISTIFSHVATQLRSLSDQASKPILYTTSLLMQSCPVEVWTPTMEQSGIFTVLAGRTLQEPTATVNTRYLRSIAHVATLSGDAFRHLLATSAQHLDTSVDVLMGAVLRQWLDRYDNQTYPSHRKMLALGLANVVQTTDHQVLEHIDEIIGVWLSALSETQENEHGESVEMTLHDPHAAAPAAVAAYPLPESLHVAVSLLHLPPPNLPTLPLKIESGYDSSGQESAVEWWKMSRTGSQDSTHVSSSPSPVWSVHTQTMPSIAISVSTSVESSYQPWEQQQQQQQQQENGDRSDDTITTDDHYRHQHLGAGVYGFGGRPGSCGGGGGSSSNSWASSTVDLADSWTSAASFQSYLNAALSQPWDSSLLNPNAHESSSATYYDDDEQIDAFDFGWSEVEGDPHIRRLHALVRNDPVHSQKLTNFISAALARAEHLNGGSEAFAYRYLAQVDKAVLKEFMDYLTGVAKGGD